MIHHGNVNPDTTATFNGHATFIVDVSFDCFQSTPEKTKRCSRILLLFLPFIHMGWMDGLLCILSRLFAKCIVKLPYLTSIIS